MNITTNYCNSKIEVDAWKTTMYLPFYYAQIYCGILYPKMSKSDFKGRF